MKMPSAFFLAAALLFVGAGCASPSPSVPSEPSDAFSSPPAASPAPETVAVPSASTTPQPITMQKTWSFPGVLPANQIANRQIRMQTGKGEVVFELFEEEAPIAVSNFIYLTKGGFYDGLQFHRYEPNFVIQGGDPLTRDPSQEVMWGTGGPGYRFQEEPVKRSYDRGIVAMAKALQPGTTGSQFFIMLKDTPLNPEYTIIGNVTKGMGIVDQLRVGDTMDSVIVEAKSK